ncbi:hypothetical protein F6455_18360 [Proteobacteria bacterium 005FR1]|nr:hypothetical protein [Proteobacteria bacterium 005FR1]
MQFAKVTAFELDSTGRQLGKVGETETDEDGSYELTLADDYTPGVIEIVVSVTDGQTKMICDALRCGDASTGAAVDLPGDFSMHSLVVVSQAQTAVSASISPWTSMAAERAKTLLSQGNSLPDAVRQSNAEINELVGFNLEKSRSRGLSQVAGAGNEESQYAILNAAAAELLFADGTFSTERFRAFIQAMNDGILAQGDAFTPGQLAKAIESVLDRNAQLDHQAIAALNNLVGRLAAADDGGVDPGYDDDLDVGDDAVTAEKIAAFQRFLSQVRTWVGVIEGLDEGALKQAVAVDSDTIERLVDEGSQAQLKFLGDLVSQSRGHLTGNFEGLQDLIVGGGTTTMDYLNWEGEKVGTITLSFSHSDGFQIGIGGSLVGKDNTVFLPFDLTLATDISLAELMAATEESFPQLFANSKIVLSGRIEDGQGTSTLLLNELSLAMGAAEHPTMTLLGDVGIRNQGVQFSGLIEVTLVRLSDEGVWLEGLESSPVSLRRFRLAGEFSSDDGVSTSSMVAVNLRNAAHIDILSWLQHSGAQRYVEVPVIGNDLPPFARYLFPNTVLMETGFGRVVLNESGMEGYLHARGYTGANGASEYKACLDNAAEVLGSAGYGHYLDIYEEKKACAEAFYVPQVVEHNGPFDSEFRQWLTALVEKYIARRYGNDLELAAGIQAERIWLDIETDPFLAKSGRMGVQFRLPEFQETEERFLEGSFTLSSRVNIPELHSAQLTATIDRTSFRGGSVIATVAAEGKTYSLALSTDDIDTPEAVNLRLFNAQGYELNINATLSGGELNALDGEALIDGEAIGSLELRDGSMPFIVYPNGDETVMESLL